MNPLLPAIPCNPDGIPDELKLWPQWVLWKLLPPTKPGGKPRKLLCDARTRKAASATDPETWTDFETARAALELYSNEFAGLGFVLTEADPFCIGDIDHCRHESGVLMPAAAGYVEMADTYTEVSQSGEGVHFIGKAKKCGNVCKDSRKGVELYQTGRYFALTGHHVPGTPTTIEDRQEEFQRLEELWFTAKSPTPREAKSAGRSLIGDNSGAKSDADLLDTAYRATNGEKIKALYHGDLGGYPTESEARMALLCLLAFYTQGEGGGGVAQLERLYRQSSRDQEKSDRLLPKECARAAEKITTTYQQARAYIPHRFTGPPHRPDAPVYGARFSEGDRQITEHEAETLRQRSLDKELFRFPMSDTGNAERLIRRNGHDLRYCTEFKQWLLWDGRRWKRDTSGAIIRYAKRTVRDIHHEAAEAGEEMAKALASHAIKSESTDKLYALVKNAATEEGIPCSVEDLDKEHFLLPVANGVLNLRTGELSPHDRRVLNTKMVNISYDPSAKCPRWERFLDWAMEGRQDDVTFLHRAIGYTLTGDTSQHAWFFLYGRGENGKSTFTDTIQLLLGGSEEYFQKASAETFLKDDRPSGGRATPQVAKLAGARLVTVTEMPASNKINEPLMKDIVSGDIIPARFLNENEFSFKACCKIWWYGNDKPGIRGTDDGIWRRVRLVPFKNKVRPEEKDARLGEKLAAEISGILTWAVRGYMDLLAQPNGVLVPSQEITEATNELRAESDSVQNFIDTQCDTDPEYQDFGGALHEAYKIWHTGGGGGTFLNVTNFGTALDKKGFKKSDKRHRSGVIRLGLRIKPDDSPDSAEEKSVYSSGKMHSSADKSPFSPAESIHVAPNRENYTQLYTQDQNYAQTVHSRPTNVHSLALLTPFVEMIQAAKEKKIPVQSLRVGAGVIENLNVWVNRQVNRFETGDEEEQKEALAELQACFTTWCGLRGEERTQ